ncbi:MAG: hypothetical protein AB7M12_00015 [Hyphomonadaceae bacterium]
MTAYLLSFGPLAIVLSIVCGAHAVRTGRPVFWIWLFIFAPGLGPAIYVIAELLPEWLGGRTANRLRAGITKALEPEREYRAAKEAVYEGPSAGARLRLGHAAMALKRYEEAETQFRQAAQGQFADDPAILMAHAAALLELRRWEEALQRMEAVLAQGAPGRTPQAALAFARAYEGLGRLEEAEAPYRFAVERMPGLEAAARYVAFLARAGRKEETREGMTEIDRRLAKTPAHFRAEARAWRDMAAAAAASAPASTSANRG